MASMRPVLLGVLLVGSCLFLAAYAFIGGRNADPNAFGRRIRALEELAPKLAETHRIVADLVAEKSVRLCPLRHFLFALLMQRCL